MSKLKDLEMRDTAIMYSSILKQIRKLYEIDEDKAGKLAISAIELILCGDISTDDLTIDLMLEPIRTLTEKNKAKWESVKETRAESKVDKLRLKEIAEMYLDGVKQDKIADKIGTSRQTINNRLKIIKAEYPELLKPNDEEAEMLDTENGDDLPGEYTGASIRVSELNKLSVNYDVVNNFAYFPSTGVRMKIVAG